MDLIIRFSIQIMLITPTGIMLVHNSVNNQQEYCGSGPSLQGKE